MKEFSCYQNCPNMYLEFDHTKDNISIVHMKTNENKTFIYLHMSVCPVF